MPPRYEVVVRGYRATTMGPTPGNDPGIWDDAFFWLTPQRMTAQNGNADPSRYGWNANAGKPMAVLNIGCWPFRRGPHRGRTPALRQIAPGETLAKKVPNDGRFSVTRTYAKGDPRNYQEAGYYAINQHSGSLNTTSSEGCLTLPPHISRSFLQTIWDDTLKARQDIIWCLLIEGPII
jgi:lysozyme